MKRLKQQAPLDINYRNRAVPCPLVIDNKLFNFCNFTRTLAPLFGIRFLFDTFLLYYDRVGS